MYAYERRYAEEKAKRIAERKAAREAKDAFWAKKNAEDRERAMARVAAEPTQPPPVVRRPISKPHCCIKGCTATDGIVTRRVLGEWQDICQAHAKDWPYTPEDAWQGFLVDLAEGTYSDHF